MTPDRTAMLAEALHDALCTVSHHDRREVYRASRGRDQPCRAKFDSIAVSALAALPPEFFALDEERLARALAPHFQTVPPAYTERERKRDRRDLEALAAAIAKAYREDTDATD